MNHRLVFFVTSSPHSDIPSLEVHSVCFVKLTYKQINLSATEGKKKKKEEKFLLECMEKICSFFSGNSVKP